MAFPFASPSRSQFATGVYEPEVTRLLTTLIQPGMSIVDLGASVGYYSLLASPLVGPAGTVYSFEPDSETYRYLALNLETNKCRNITPARYAVSSSSGISSFRRPTFERGYLLNRASDDRTDYQVETISLDAFFSKRSWPRIDLIKMDIEGAELAALSGMNNLSKRNPQLRIIMEYNRHAMNRAGVTGASLASHLRELGFRTARVVEKHLKGFALTDGLPNSPLIFNLLIER